MPAIRIHVAKWPFQGQKRFEGTTNALVCESGRMVRVLKRAMPVTAEKERRGVQKLVNLAV